MQGDTIAAMSEIANDNDIEPGASDAAAEVSQHQRALRSVLMEIENGAASVGWDRPPSIYALVPTKQLMDTPEVPADVLADLEGAWDGTDTHLSAILQESVVGDELEELLPKLAWPDSVWGAAVTVERIDRKSVV